MKAFSLLAACLGAAIVLGPVSGHAQTLKREDIAPFRVIYDVGNNILTAGNAELVLSENEDDSWHYVLQTRPRGVFKLAGKGHILEESHFRIVDSENGVELQSIDYKYRQDKERRRSVDATWDWEARAITSTYRGETATFDFAAPVIDRLSVTLLMMNALRHDFYGATIKVFDNHRIKNVELINEGNELLKTPLGDIETIRVTNRNAAGGSRTTTTWFAPSLDYMPIRIEQRKRGKLVARLKLIDLENRQTRAREADNQ
ncbi:MAG: hypothetical protein CSB44_07910 [Gammaproteobacteria bacterium]|nr:MAG: hypothetical protein CSB44_07910 [Gammaproteobacteria bacterium]